MKQLCLILLFYHAGILYAQTDSTYQINEIVNSILEESTIDVEDSQLFDLIEDLLNNPINVNSASVNDLLKIPTIDLPTANGIIEHKRKYGKYFSTNELYSIKNVTGEEIDKIIPFVTVGEKQSADDIISMKRNQSPPLKLNYRSRFIEDIQNRRGFIENKYEGNKVKLYNRFKGKFNNYRINLLTEKDAGEKSLADFQSFSFSADKISFFEKIILGDYLIEFGQGLAAWGPYAFSKGGEAISSVTRNGRGLIPYSSSDENQFYRGGAAKINYNNFDFTFFYSSNNIDANIDEAGFITSTPVDGYHRTDNEISKKHKTNEKTVGAIVDFSPIENSQINFLFYNSQFSGTFLPGKIYDLQGNKFNFYSLSYSTLFNKFYFNGEFAFNGISAASINNLEITINKTFSFVVSIRNYPRNFYNIHSNGFGENSNTQNEFGIYAGIKTKLKTTEINLYYDQFKFPFASFSNPLPSQGNEFLIDVYHSFSSKTKIKLRYTKEIKETLIELNSSQTSAKQIKQKVRLELFYNISKRIRLKSRVELTGITVKESKISDSGFLVFQDLRISPFNNLNLYARLIFFDTKSYDTRVYEFENDLTGVLNNAALFGKGTKWYFLINYNFLKNFKISAKYSELYQPGLTTLSSGLNEIVGSVNSKLSLQLDFVF